MKLLLYSQIIICNLFFPSTCLHAQADLIKGTKDSYIPAKQLAGIWYQADSAELTIEFVNTPSDFMLKVDDDRPYYFYRDSIGNVYHSGYIPNWPPLDCELKFLSKDTLKICYGSMGRKNASYLFVRNRK